MISSTIGESLVRRGPVGHGDRPRRGRRDHDSRTGGQRDRRQPPGQEGPHRSSAAPTSTASRRARASTTTAPAPSATLETAEQVARLKGKPRNRLRFAFWGAEEAGLVGSTAYVAEQAGEWRHRPDRGEPELRHGRVAQLRPLRPGRRPLRQRAAPERRARRIGADRGHVRALLPLARAGLEADALRRPLRLRPVHRERRRRGRSVHGRRGRSRRPRRRRSSAVPPDSPTTPATTRPATRSRT